MNFKPLSENFTKRQTDRFYINKIEKIDFYNLFSTYIQSNRDLETKSILNIRSELNDNLKKKHSFKEEIKVLRTKIKEEDYLYHQAEIRISSKFRTTGKLRN